MAEIGHIQNRATWNFPYAADVLHKAALSKVEHHKERLAWWRAKRDEVTTTIKAEGLDFDESLAANRASNTSYGRQPSVQIRDDLLRDLSECNTKILEHKDKLDGYESWVEVLASQGQAHFDLNLTDWMYFFSKR